ncbi:MULTISPECIES: nitroreductase [unclassified Iodidimonas]|jgi:nitroreductase|uniref:nitroreductase family protein n=1 Tax=unclassified Iodidimonas TaxID=2626145 RepID=UPI0024829EE0|nr:MULTISPECIES: nitroreductase [unclassified Iodidimonas]
MSLNKARPEAIDVLLTRRSVKTRDMITPGPDAQALARILEAAMRVPDHGKLTPWRFFVFEGEGQEALSAIITQAFQQENPDCTSAQLAKMEGFARQAPLLVVLASCPSDAKPIALWEQQLSAGASAMAMLMAAHMLGYVGQWLTDWPAYSQAVHNHLGLGSGDRIAGFLFFGSAAAQPAERPRPDMADLVRFFGTEADEGE